MSERHHHHHLADAASLDALCEALLRCGCVSYAPDRRAVIEAWRERVGVLIPVDESPSDRMQVTHMLRASLKYAAGLELLVDTVAIFEGEPDDLLLECERLLPGLLPYRLRLQLRRALADLALPPAELAELYRASIHTAVPPLPADGAQLGLQQLVHHLLNIPALHGAFPFPVLEFVERAALRRPAALARMREWVDRAAFVLGLDGGALARMRQAATRQGERPAAQAPGLLVEIAPASYEADRYEVDAWLWRGDGEVLCVRPDGRSFSEAALREVLDGLHRRVLAELPERLDALTVEFALPRELMCWDVDQWTVRLGRRSAVRLGQSYRVVLRWRERLRDRQYWSFWPARWRALLDPAAPGERVYWLPAAGRYDRGADELLMTRLLRDRGLACLAIPFAVPDAPGDDDPDPLYTALDQGTPVALWLRDPHADPAEVRLALAHALDPAALADLPERVRALRLEGPPPIAGHLALLWDDYDRREVGASPLLSPAPSPGA